MTHIGLAIVAGYGTHLLYTALVFGWHGARLAPVERGRSMPSLAVWLARAGLDHVRPAEFVAAVAVLFVVGFLIAYAVFGAPLPALAVGAFAASFPPASYRARRVARVRRARDGWPQLLEEVRVLTGSAGRSIPQALFDAGRHAPGELRAGFDAAHREWMVSTDFERALAVLKARLTDPTADAACETLLVAHEVGGTDLDQRLLALVDDRTADVQGRKDAEAKQAGVRFARKFVLVVPVGMALAGMSVGTGRAAYAGATGQVAVLAAVAMVVGCWAWAGRIMRLPQEARVFDDAAPEP